MNGNENSMVNGSEQVIDHCDNLLHAVKMIRSTPHKMNSLSKQKKSTIHSLYKNLKKLKEASSVENKNTDKNEQQQLSEAHERVSMRYIHTSNNDGQKGVGCNSPQLLKALVADFTNLVKTEEQEVKQNKNEDKGNKSGKDETSQSLKMEISDDEGTHDNDNNNVKDEANSEARIENEIVEPILQALNDIPLIGNDIDSNDTPSELQEFVSSSMYLFDF